MYHLLTQSKKSAVRQGVIKTLHGEIQTPFFMPDATQGAVKLIESEKIKAIGVPAMVVNTLHLYLQPGLNIIKKAGGIHNFMNWHGPLLSDSGGYQVFSLIYKSHGKMGKIFDDKVVFKSPVDGSRHELTPEKSIQIQFALGTDMMVCLDDVRPNDVDREEAEAAVERTIKWAKRCKKEFERQLNKNGAKNFQTPFRTVADASKEAKKKNKITSPNPPPAPPAEGNIFKKEALCPLLFGVVQGGMFPDLRKYCAEELVKIGFDGLGFGARPVAETGEFLTDVVQATTKAIPKNYLRFALGVGTPEDIVCFARLGWDMFDCVIPTREGRHGRLYQFKRKDILSPTTPSPSSGRRGYQSGNFYHIININNAKFANDFSPINKESEIPELRHYSKAYLHHLFKVSEALGQRLASLNNLEFYATLLVKLAP